MPEDGNGLCGKRKLAYAHIIGYKTATVSPYEIMQGTFEERSKPHKPL